jgi:hypothetical protein
MTRQTTSVPSDAAIVLLWIAFIGLMVLLATAKYAPWIHQSVEPPMSNRFISSGNPDIYALGEEVHSLRNRMSYLESEIARSNSFDSVVSPILMAFLFFVVWGKVGRHTGRLFRSVERNERG